MTSQLNVDTIANKAGSGTVAFTKQEGVKARVNYNDNTPAIIESFNTSSAADVSTGRWTTTRTNNMNSTHYSASGACGRAGFSYNSGDLEMPIVFPTTSLISFYTYNYDASVGDNQYISGQIDGDLA